jgi:hypothetical protein
VVRRVCITIMSCHVMSSHSNMFTSGKTERAPFEFFSRNLGFHGVSLDMVTCEGWFWASAEYAEAGRTGVGD